MNLERMRVETEMLAKLDRDEESAGLATQENLSLEISWKETSDQLPSMMCIPSHPAQAVPSRARGLLVRQHAQAAPTVRRGLQRGATTVSHRPQDGQQGGSLW